MHQSVAEISSRFVAVNGIRLHCVDAGTGPLVLLLHGFPDFWYTWQAQIPALVQAGFRVLACDLRGYNLSDKPEGIASYQLDVLARDVIALIRSQGDRAHLVGHDWGGVIAWAVAARQPGAIDRLVVVNAPHPVRFAEELTHPRQLLLSWYVFAFQLPRVPEWLLRRNDYQFARQTLLENPRAFSESDLVLYREAWLRPGAMEAGVNYYRALARTFARDRAWLARRITAPTLLLWGDRDRYLGTRLTQGLDRWIANLRVDRIASAGHWVHREQPERVNAILTEFLSQPKTADSPRAGPFSRDAQRSAPPINHP